MNRLLFSGALALSTVVVGVMSVATQAHAVLYGDFSSPTGSVSFLSVTDLNGLFGMPAASANSLDFSPNAFEIDCASVITCPPAPGSATDTLTFQIDANTGFFIEDIILSESGDTTLNDFALPTGFAVTTVVANVFIDILELDGASVSGINANASMIFTSGGTYDTLIEGSGSLVWTGLLSLDVDAAIDAAAQVGRATLVEVSMANTLTAYAENGAIAFIEKKDIDGLVITVVPEPGAFAVMGLGLTGLATVNRRTPQKAASERI